MSKDEFALVERLARCIADERYRRYVGPGWDVDAAAAARRVIEGLGLRQAEASHVFPAREPLEKIRPHIEAACKSGLAAHIVKETPLTVQVEIGRADEFPGQSRMTIRCWVVTKNGVE